MTYELEFLPSAQKEWRKLGYTVREQFTRKLRRVLEEPHRPAARLHAMPDCYKIKLKDSGYRLVYRVIDRVVVVQVVAIGKRDGDVYDDAIGRLDS
ncbi:type II toxin-antitoxin system RelE/ParE family toxin [Sphingomonas sp.]|jgi:mRNA interferase RelE/StbE|uniref:type II toxin-antitoxin system RelE family toxin n=1 Tax=Sphingomonas sp. TaxID=28214 RepID=UPI002DE9456F|nr:type II toxin-antitoxin system RelE/ParE family toxin [Sphingomonas sp.]